MRIPDYPVTEDTMYQIHKNKFGVYKLLDSRTKFITDIPGSDLYEILRHESYENKLAFQEIISNEIINDPFYEFFVSLEITEKGQTTRIVEDERGGWYFSDVTQENIREKSSNYPIFDETLENIHSILIPFLNQISIIGDAKVYAEIVSRKNYQARGVIEYNSVYGAYLYRTY